LYAEGLKRIARSGENDFRRFLLAECLEAYAELDEAQKDRVEELLHTEAYREIEPLMKTTYERGIEQGIERGIEQGIERGIEQGIERGIEQGIERGIEQGERRLTLRLLQAKFGPLSPKFKEQVEALSSEALAQLQLDLLRAQSLEQLGLKD
jgi:flagellar biosynthesis/type III secretory pathway protein FliH